MKSTVGSRKRLAKAQDGICPWCKLPLPDDLADTAIDHIIPRCRGGPSAPWNRQLLHFKCNGPAGKWHKLTPEAEKLAEEHGVIVHLPIPASAIANRPLTRLDAMRQDWLSTPSSASAEERDSAFRQYLDALGWGDAVAR